MPKAASSAEGVKELEQPTQILLAEFEIKRRRLCEQMASSELAGVQLQRTENIAWLTAGRVDRRVLLPSATGIATILVLRSGDAFYFAPDNEARRLAEEDFAGLPITAITTPWHAADFSAKIRSLAGDGRIAADIVPEGGALLLEHRASLADSEVERYRWLGRNTAEVTAIVLHSLQPGVTERTMAATRCLGAPRARHRTLRAADGGRRPRSTLQTRRRAKRDTRALRHAEPLFAPLGTLHIHHPLRSFRPLAATPR